MLNIHKLNLDRNRRVVMVSDIHANLSVFKRLLEKIHYRPDDYLFIIGDLCEKGLNSLETVRYVKKMTEQSSNVFVTKGNCDVLYQYVFKGDERIFNYMKVQQNSILNEMLKEKEKTIEDFQTVQQLAQFYKSHFQEELHWIESMPVAIETEEFIMIHAGIEDRPDWENTEENTALSLDSFMDRGHEAKKPVIVGHWPSVNYRYNTESSNNPMIDLEKNIIAIDGGNQIKRDGQLNALIYENDQFSFEFVDELNEEIKVQKDYLDQTKRVGTVTYPNYEMSVVRKEPDFTLCHNKKLGYEQWVKNEYLVENDKGVYCKMDLSTTFLSVNQGEIVKVLDDEQTGYLLVKKQDGSVGWLPREVL
ncbi:metallophosphoesterase [Bacillus sp. S/N-304-OC-R1]|uniref:metallophosphoesterase n=1 Tax=Bacillus sp. S/N-304-OC-R1 TaxID=2758034 RepID=UPI001C8E699F|nr:metallophosphoesterase [Bacillus sp. S/N-304-OC-R1]MBY0122758.1 metallophosphoesterase [Bacillus sp. S/N-304-OC-R1]